jgi:hypothetical protein
MHFEKGHGTAVPLFCGQRQAYRPIRFKIINLDHQNALIEEFRRNKPRNLPNDFGKKRLHRNTAGAFEMEERSKRVRKVKLEIRNPGREESVTEAQR